MLAGVGPATKSSARRTRSSPRPTPCCMPAPTPVFAEIEPRHVEPRSRRRAAASRDAADASRSSSVASVRPGRRLDALRSRWRAAGITDHRGRRLRDRIDAIDGRPRRLVGLHRLLELSSAQDDFDGRGRHADDRRCRARRACARSCARLPPACRIRIATKHSGVVYEEYRELGYNYRMTDLQAAIGIEQLEKLDRLLAARAARSRRATTRRSAASRRAVCRRVPVTRQHAFQSYGIRLLADCPLDARRPAARARRGRRLLPPRHSADSPRSRCIAIAWPASLRCRSPKQVAARSTLPADLRVAGRRRSGARHRRRGRGCVHADAQRRSVLDRRPGAQRGGQPAPVPRGGHGACVQAVDARRLGIRLRRRRQPRRIVRDAEELRREDERVRAIRFPRNFGSHVAIAAGIDHCRGDARRDHGGRSPGSAGADARVRRPLARRLRRRLGRAHRPRRRRCCALVLMTAFYVAGPPLRDPDVSERRHRQLLPDRQAGDRHVPPVHGAQSADLRADRVGGVPRDRSAVSPPGA